MKGSASFANYFEGLPAAVYATDTRGHVTFYNHAVVELSGYRPELGSDQWPAAWPLYRPDGTPLPYDQSPMAVALRENRPVRGAEAVAERPDGTRVPFIPYPTPLHDASGTLIGAVNVLVDVSERKQAETAQKVLLDELNRRPSRTTCRCCTPCSGQRSGKPTARRRKSY